MCIYICTYVYICVYIYMCVYICMYMYEHGVDGAAPAVALHRDLLERQSQLQILKILKLGFNQNDHFLL